MDLLGEVGTNGAVMSFGLGSIFKVVFTLLFVLYVSYSFFLALRIRILSNTVQTPWNKTLRRLAFFHLYAVIVGGGVALFFIFVA